MKEIVPRYSRAIGAMYAPLKSLGKKSSLVEEEHELSSKKEFSLWSLMVGKQPSQQETEGKTVKPSEP